MDTERTVVLPKNPSEPAAPPADFVSTRKRSPATIAFASLAAVLVIVLAVLSVNLSMARADLSSNRARLVESQSTLADTKTNLKRAQESLQSKTAELARTQTDLAGTQVTLGSTQTDLATANGNLQQARVTLSAATLDLAKSRGDLASLSADLSSTRADLMGVRADLAKSRADYTSQLAELKLAREQVATVQTTLANLQTNYDRMAAGAGYVSRDPTYAQVKSFLQNDPVQFRTYNADTYNCVNFSADLMANASKLGIRAGYVNIDFPTQGHAAVAFNTTDRGIVYIEPQHNEEVNLRTGARYYQSVTPRPGYFYRPPSYDDTVVRFIVIW